MFAATTFESTQSSTRLESAAAPRNTGDLKGLALVLMIIGMCLVLLHTHLFLHTGHGLVAVAYDPAAHLGEFDFIGGKANGYTVTLEISIWSLVGLNCRMAYIVGRATLVGEVAFVRMLAMWLSTTVFGWGTTTALVSLLCLVKLDIGAVTLGLSRLEAIVTISFILGFYNDETRRVLGLVRGVFRQVAAGKPDERDRS